MVTAAGVLSLLGTPFVFAEDTKIATKTDRVSLLEVPLRCEAAPEIGCGSRSKPILRELEREPVITEAWLNGAGTVLAVVGTEGSTRDSRSKAIQTILEKNGATGTELEGEPRETELKSFISGKDWYRGAEVDTLSKREARTIAARLVHRIQTKAPLAQEKAKALEISVANAFERRFIGSLSDANATTRKREQLAEELSRIAHENLDAKEIVAFEEAVSKGIRPLPEDQEETKTETTAPDCCSAKSPTQSWTKASMLESRKSTTKNGIGFLVAGIVAAIGASACCLGPLVLLALGVSGAWIGSLTALEPFRPIFIGLTLLFLAFAFHRLYLARLACSPGSACANPRTLNRQRLGFWIVTILLLGLMAVPWFIPLFD
jgi:mercuric ion transport protein